MAGTSGALRSRDTAAARARNNYVHQPFRGRRSRVAIPGLVPIDVPTAALGITSRDCSEPFPATPRPKPGIVWTHPCKMSSFKTAASIDLSDEKLQDTGRNHPPKTGGPKGHSFGSRKRAQLQGRTGFR